VPSIEDLFSKDRSAVREPVLSSSKNLVLVAPYWGHGGIGKKSTFTVRDVKGNWGERFLNQVLAALAVLRGSGQSFGIGKLILACHSAGGQGMRAIVGTLGGFKGKLTECWGFDCLYTTGLGSDGLHPERDDANFWNKWLRGDDARPLFIFCGYDTVPQSVKLHLQGRGLATDRGARRDPPDPREVDKLTVRLGIDDPRSLEGLMGLSDLLKPARGRRRRPPPDPQFAKKASDNVRSNITWPQDQEGMNTMHYQIAKDHFLERLKGAGF
jgi:hypothetical protein